MTLSPTHFKQILKPTAGCCCQLIPMKEEKKRKKNIYKGLMIKNTVVNKDTLAKRIRTIDKYISIFTGHEIQLIIVTILYQIESRDDI